MFISEPFPFEASVDASSGPELAAYGVLVAIALVVLVVMLAAATGTSAGGHAPAHTASSQMVRQATSQRRAPSLRR